MIILYFIRTAQSVAYNLSAMRQLPPLSSGNTFIRINIFVEPFLNMKIIALPTLPYICIYLFLSTWVQMEQYVRRLSNSRPIRWSIALYSSVIFQTTFATTMRTPRGEKFQLWNCTTVVVASSSRWKRSYDSGCIH